ncbi:hypothetical protein CQA66_01905 [Helicobacter aurati]|uniref:Lipoprotein n=1 Tax=Helicobacter aurati TaxID=137778 RepID=A0A3D8J7H0_9HELI|nr:hypothetical protein [Helicobacter aurati]RDU73439.1 hypothetical protein CQA66_01905 [Helicobacter aurati]
MKFWFFTLSTSIALASVFSGCSKIAATKMEKNVQYVMQFNSNDFIIGNIISSEMPYSNNPNIEALLLNQAIKEHKCDTILLPRYEVIKKTLGKDIIRITGRAATFKTK